MYGSIDHLSNRMQLSQFRDSWSQACTQLAMLPVLCRWTLAFGIPDSLWLLVVMGLDSCWDE